MRHPTLWFAGLAVLLASCNPQPTPPETKPQSGNVYQINFRLTNDTAATASISKTTGILRAEALEAAPQPITLNDTPLTVTTFVTKKNGVDIRHIHATFAFTNNTSQTLNNLIFLPVVRSDVDSDPANNTQPTTVAGTPFLNVKYYDGSDASSLASSLTTNQAQKLDVSTGEAVIDPNASPYLTGLDISNVTASADPGLTATVQNQGWVTLSPLAPAGTSKVTFAVELPVDRSNPKGQPFAFSMLVTQAQDVTGSSIGNTLDPTHIQGTIQPWAFKAGEKLNALYYSSDTMFQNRVLGDIDVMGGVNLTLPPPNAIYVDSFLNGCTFSGTRTASDFKYAQVYLSAVTNGDDRLGSVALRTTDGTRYYPFYSDTTGQFKGTATCLNNEQRDVDLNLVRGWNAVSLTFSTLSSGVDVYTYRNLPLSARASNILAFTPTPEELWVSFPDLSTMNLTAGGSATRSIQIQQRGGISGDVTLETSVPGITVSPATLTLPDFTLASVPTPGLKAQRLTAQALNTTLTFNAYENAQAYTGLMDIIIKKNGAEVGRSSLYVNLVVPGITVNTFQTFQTEIPVGSTKIRQVQVQSVNGFTGTTTITLSGLPTGVTASEATVSLTSGGTATADISISVASGTPLQMFNANVTGPKVTNQNTFNTLVALTVVAPRIPLSLQSANKSAPATNGVWVLGQASSYSPVLVRVQGNQVVQQETVANTYDTLLPTLNGDVFAITTGTDPNTYTYSYVVTRIQPDGTHTIRYLNYNDMGWAFPSGVADGLGNIWFVKRDSTGSSPAALARFSINDGNVTIMDTTQPYADFGNLLRISPNGAFITVLNNSSPNAFQFEVATSTIKAISMGGFYSRIDQFLTDNAGVIYGLSDAGNVIKVSPSGTTTLTTEAFGTIYGLDRANPSILWLGRSGDGIWKLDNQTQVLIKASYHFASTIAASLDLNGGLWFISDSNYPFGPFSYYASFLP